MNGKVCVLDIEIEGVKQVRNSHLNPILVFINPPSIEELERRLRGRNTESEESLQKRLNTAKIEIEYGKFGDKSGFVWSTLNFTKFSFVKLSKMYGKVSKTIKTKEFFLIGFLMGFFLLGLLKGENCLCFPGISV